MPNAATKKTVLAHNKSTNHKWPLITTALFFALAFVGLVFFPEVRRSVPVKLDSQEIQAQLATTQNQRAKGLGNTDKLDEHEGMLFVFDRADTWPIWMKDMQYPIDIVWLDDNKRIVHIAANVSPDTYPQSFKSDTPARYVLELPAGYADQHTISTGSQATFSF